MSDLRSKIIRLAHVSPELRPHLLPLLKEGGRQKKPRKTFSMRTTADGFVLKDKVSGKSTTHKVNPYWLKSLRGGYMGARDMDDVGVLEGLLQKLDKGIKAFKKPLSQQMHVPKGHPDAWMSDLSGSGGSLNWSAFEQETGLDTRGLSSVKGIHRFRANLQAYIDDLKQRKP